jgi:hypothetical protein
LVHQKGIVNFFIMLAEFLLYITDKCRSIGQGDDVREDTPFKFKYFFHELVSRGRPKEHDTLIYCDRTSRAPVLYRDEQVVELVKLTADISAIPEWSIPKIKGADGEMYYRFDFTIDVTYQSASTKYEFVHQGK